LFPKNNNLIMTIISMHKYLKTIIISDRDIFTLICNNYFYIMSQVRYLLIYSYHGYLFIFLFYTVNTISTLYTRRKFLFNLFFNQIYIVLSKCKLVF
jgi:hypothetical protein